MTRRLLLVGGESPPVLRLERSLGEAGFEIVRSPDGFYTALWLERDHAAAVVVVAPLEDMEPRELAAILHSEGARTEVPCLALVPAAGEPEDAEAERCFDVVAAAAALPSRLMKALGSENAVEAGPPGGASKPSRGLYGNLALIDFANLVQILGETRKPGVLRLDLEGSEALVFFANGEITHCIWGGCDGLQAFRRILKASAASTADFYFEASTTNGRGRQARTLGGPVARLLLELAVEMDGDRQPNQPSQTGGAGHA